MGLSSSQGRLLLLTSRLSDIELNEILLTQRQQQLAIDKENVAKEYHAALNNHKINIKVPDVNDPSKIEMQNISYENMKDAGYFLTDGKGHIYLKKKPDGTWDIPHNTDDAICDIEYATTETSETNDSSDTSQNGNETASEQDVTTPTATDDNGTESSQTETESSTSANQAKKKPDILKFKARDGISYEIIEGGDFINNTNSIKDAIVNGAVYILKVETTDVTTVAMQELNSNTDFEYVLDTSDDAQAESKYEYEMAKISRQDNMIDMEMQQLETQHEAVLKEYESIRKVISNNIDRTFNLFSDG